MGTNGTNLNFPGQGPSLNGTQMLSLSQSLYNSQHVGGQMQAMSMNNLNFYPVQGEFQASPH